MGTKIVLQHNPPEADIRPPLAFMSRRMVALAKLAEAHCFLRCRPFCRPAKFLMPRPAKVCGSPGILKVDLSQRKCHSDGRDNDDSDYKPPIGGSDLFFALRATRPLQIGHRDALPFAFNRDFQHTRAGALILIKN